MSSIADLNRPIDEYNYINSLIWHIKNCLKIEEVISKHIDIEKCGNEKFRAKCPFHNDKKPSLFIFASTNSYYCFGCGKGGDIINFIMEIKCLNFKDAVQYLESF